MRVRAVARGLYGGRLTDPGTEFEIVSDDHLASWMEPTEEKDRARFAAKLAAWGRSRRVAVGPDVPPTTRFLRDPPKPKATAKESAKEPVKPAKE